LDAHFLNTSSVKIRAWVICELCRIWNLKVPSNLSLSPNTKKLLESLGLLETDFNREDYPYVDAIIFALRRNL